MSEKAVSLVGAILEGAYRIESLLGEGGMGAVYAATHLRLGKSVAVKVMARELASNTEALMRFHREAQVTSALGHPHIVQVFDFSTTPTGEPFLAMEFLDGEDLDHRLRRVGRLPCERVVHIVKQVASALAATHSKAIVHRDLKPGNIFLIDVAGESDFVKVLDFGISKARSATTKLTRTAAILGTPNYMSPEQAKGKVEEIDERTDQWALACIAWECLSGEGPFIGENVPSILFQIVHEPPPSLLPKVSGLHPEVEDVLLRALSKDKNERFPSVSDFATALEAAVARAEKGQAAGVALLPRTMQLPDSAEARPEPLVSLPSTFRNTAGEVEETFDEVPTRPKWIWGVVASGVVVLTVGGYLLFRPGPTARPVVTPLPGQQTPGATAPPAPLPPAIPANPPPQPMPKEETRAAETPEPSPSLTRTPPAEVPTRAGDRLTGPEATRASQKRGIRAKQGIQAPEPTPAQPREPTADFEDPFQTTAKKMDRPSQTPAAKTVVQPEDSRRPSESTRPIKTRSMEDRWRVE